MHDGYVIELVGGPRDGYIERFKDPDEPGDYISVPIGPPGYWSWENKAMYFRTGRVTEDGRHVYQYAIYHPMRFS